MAELWTQTLAPTEDKSLNLFKDCVEILLKWCPPLLILLKSLRK
jgi:hypothetical protein